MIKLIAILLVALQSSLLASSFKEMPTAKVVFENDSVLYVHSLTVSSDSLRLETVDGYRSVVLSEVSLAINSYGDIIFPVAVDNLEGVQKIMFEAGSDLRSYASMQYKALVLSLLGNALAIYGASEGKDGLLIGGSVLSIGGFSISILAPKKIDAAGKKIQNASKSD
jgi:hypothetical protein